MTVRDKKTKKYFCSSECLNNHQKAGGKWRTEVRQCKKCGKSISHGTYSLEKVGEKHKDFFCSIECLVGKKENSVVNKKKLEPKESVNENKDNKNRIIFGIIFLVVILFLGLIAYTWKRKKR